MTGIEIAILKEAQEGFYKAFFKESSKQLSKISNYLSSSPSFEKKSPSLEQIKDFICYNQGAYAQYNFIVPESCTIFRARNFLHGK